MKLTIFLLTAAFLSARATGVSQSITLSADRMDMKMIFQSIKAQTGYVVFYNARHLQTSKPVSVDVKNVSLAQFMDLVLKDQPLTFEIRNKNILIKEKMPEQRPELSGIEVLIPPVTGIVKGSDGEPLSGVNIMVKGTKTGTVTNASGQFTINANQGADLVISSIGYVTRQVTISGTALPEIILQRSANSLDDVVVVGYGSRRRSEVTGAIATVKASELTQTPIANLAQGLQGRVSGLQITQNNAAPGGSISVRLRGTNSINGSSEPLYIIDGIQVQNNTGSSIPGNALLNKISEVGGNSNEVSPLTFINPNDIESIEVLKDASAAAIYGSQAANGVIIITTKRGKAGASKISYDGYYGVQKVTKKIDLLNAAEFAKIENEVYNQVRFPNPDSLGEGTFWQDVIFRTAKMQSHQLTFSGGNDKTQLLVSANYFDQEGIVINSRLRKFSFRINLDHTINKWLKIGTATTFSRSVNNRIQTGSTVFEGGALSQSMVGASLQAPPVLKPYKDGLLYPFAQQPYGQYYVELRNPLSGSTSLDETGVNTILSNVYLSLKVLKGLEYKATFDAYTNSSLNNYYFPGSAFTPAELAASGGLGGYGLKNNSNFIRLMHESILSYTKTLGSDHSVNLTGVFSAVSTNNNYNYLIGFGFVNDATKNEALQLAKNFSNSTGRTKENLLSWLGRMSYNFRNKYFVDLIGRVDGSSKFGENNKYGFFPAVSFAWNVKQESFMSDVDAVSSMKLRISRGTTGNQAAVGPYQSLATVAAGSDYAFNNVYTRGISPKGIANPDLKWEKSTQSNLGLDVDLLNSRISITADVYLKKTVDLIFSKSLPLSSGYGTVTGNFASIQNKGIELAINYTPVRNKDFSWNVTGTFTINRNELLRLADDSAKEFAISNYTVLSVGRPIGIYKTYIFNGIHQTGETILPGQPVTNPRPGTQKVKDVTGGPQGKPDGIITDADRVINGDANPDFIYSFNSTLKFKQVDLGLLFSGVYGNNIFNLARYQLENPLGNRNVVSEMVNRWTPTNPSNEYQTSTGSLAGRTPITDRYIENGSFLRCKNITIGYNLSSLKAFSLARVYISANNLFTVTDYKGFDPEVGSFGGSNTQIGVDNIVYPVSKSFLLGIQFTL